MRRSEKWGSKFADREYRRERNEDRTDPYGDIRHIRSLQPRPPIFFPITEACVVLVDYVEERDRDALKVFLKEQGMTKINHAMTFVGYAIKLLNEDQACSFRLLYTGKTISANEAIRRIKQEGRAYER